MPIEMLENHMEYNVLKLKRRGDLRSDKEASILRGKAFAGI